MRTTIIPGTSAKYRKQKEELITKAFYERNYGPFPSQFCDRLRILRERAVLTKTDVANALDMTLQRYHRYEKGTAEPSLSILPKLARILGTDVNTLVGDFNTDVFFNEHILPEPFIIESSRMVKDDKEYVHLSIESEDSAAINDFNIPAEDFDTLITYAKNYARLETKGSYDRHFTQDIVFRLTNYILRHNGEFSIDTDGEESTEENIEEFFKVLLDARKKLQEEADKEFWELIRSFERRRNDEKKK